MLRADIREHLDAENAYTKAMLAGDRGRCRPQLFAEMKGRIKEDDSSVPSPDGPVRLLRALRRSAAEHPVLAAGRAASDDGEEVLLDDDALAKGKAYFQVGAAEPQPRPPALRLGRRRAGLGVLPHPRSRTWRAARPCAPPIESATGDFAFSPDSQWLFWIWRDENGRPAKVFRRPAAGRRGRRWSMSEADEGLFVRRGRHRRPQLHPHRHAGDHETSEILADPGRRPDRRAGGGRAAHAGA